MKERGILFSAPMVRALLGGTKTQTRRSVRWRGAVLGLNLGFSGLGVSHMPSGWVLESPTRSSSEWRCEPTPCPYGQPGERLWVRERWAAPHAHDHLLPSLIPSNVRVHYAADQPLGGLRGRPSIFMPRWASRITLEITGVRVERLRNISEADAKAEGVQPKSALSDAHRHAYVDLWEQINGAGSWMPNPWVWVVSFKRIEGAAS